MVTNPISVFPICPECDNLYMQQIRTEESRLTFVCHLLKLFVFFLFYWCVLYICSCDILYIDLLNAMTDSVVVKKKLFFIES